MKWAWRHDDYAERWEYGYWDVDRNTFVTCAAVVDEIVEIPKSASLIRQKIGSVPPPLETS